MKKTTQLTIATHLGVSTKTVQAFLSRNSIGQPYNLENIRLAYIRHLSQKAAGRHSEGSLDLSQERAALAKAQRTRIEIETKARAGELLEAKRVVHLWSNIIAELRACILQTDIPEQIQADLIESCREIPTAKYCEK